MATKLYSRLSDRETVLELWGASTKHPDSTFYFSNFNLSAFFEPEEQTYQWLLECASKLTIPFHAYALVVFANQLFEAEYEEDWEALKKVFRIPS